MKIYTTYDIYRQSTGLNGKADKRGSKIQEVDRAFQEYEAKFDKAALTEKLELTTNLFLACKLWLQKKAAKSDINKSILFADTINQNLVNRRKAISDLALECLYALSIMDQTLVAETAFDIKKIQTLAKGSSKPEVKALASGYENERKLYLANKKNSSPPSATILGGFVTHSEIEKMDLKAFKKQAEKYQVDTVKFIKKEARLKLLAVPDVHGLLRRPDTDALIDCGLTVSATGAQLFIACKTSAFRNAVYAYAMDRYGNLFTCEIEDPTTLQAQGYGSFNHSSFNAGADVICAGTILIDKGKLRWIDNNSGHYKPTPDNLRNAIEVLANDGVDLSDLCAAILTIKPQMMINVYSRDAFLAKAAQPDVGRF